MFPYAEKADIADLVDGLNTYTPEKWGETWKGTLTYFVQHQVTLPSNWTKIVVKANRTSPYNGYYFDKVTPQKAYALQRAFDFMEHRVTVKRYIRYLFRSFLIFEYFDYQEADEMRKIFWSADIECKNDFECTESTFYEKFGEKFKNFDFVKVDLNLLANAIRRIPTISKNLYFNLDVGNQ